MRRSGNRCTLRCRPGAMPLGTMPWSRSSWMIRTQQPRSAAGTAIWLGYGLTWNRAETRLARKVRAPRRWLDSMERADGVLSFPETGSEPPGDERQRHRGFRKIQVVIDRRFCTTVVLMG